MKEAKDFRHYLQELFVQRCQANSSYSLRSFARSLSVSPATLSTILNDRRPVTVSMRNKIGLAIGMSPEEINGYYAQKHGNSQTSAEDPKPSSQVDYQQIALDSFYVVSEWYHYAILQLMRTKDFTWDAKQMAGRLGITTVQVNLAIERMTKIGLLEEEGGQLVDRSSGHTTHLKKNYTNEALRNFQKNALKKAIEALELVDVKHRDNTAMTMAISKEAIPHAKERITKFRRELSQELESFEEPDEVYQLLISLTPLTLIKEK